MNVRNNEITYGCEIKEIERGGKIKYRYMLHRFFTKYERGLWLREGNMKRNEFVYLADKPRNRVSPQHPMVRLAQKCCIWPVTFVTDSDGQFRLYRKITGMPNPDIDLEPLTK